MKLNLFLSLSGGTAILASGLLLLAGPAPAQVFGSHNSNAPVNFNAGRIEVQDRADRVVLSGAVRVEQAGLVLNAARMTVAYRNAGGIEIDRIDASGGVTVRKAGDTASATHHPIGQCHSDSGHQPSFGRTCHHRSCIRQIDDRWSFDGRLFGRVPGFERTRIRYLHGAAAQRLTSRTGSG